MLTTHDRNIGCRDVAGRTGTIWATAGRYGTAPRSAPGRILGNEVLSSILTGGELAVSCQNNAHQAQSACKSDFSVPFAVSVRKSLSFALLGMRARFGFFAPYISLCLLFSLVVLVMTVAIAAMTIAMTMGIMRMTMMSRTADRATVAAPQTASSFSRCPDALPVWSVSKPDRRELPDTAPPGLFAAGYVRWRGLLAATGLRFGPPQLRLTGAGPLRSLEARG